MTKTAHQRLQKARREVLNLLSALRSELQDYALEDLFPGGDPVDAEACVHRLAGELELERVRLDAVFKQFDEAVLGVPEEAPPPPPHDWKVGESARLRSHPDVGGARGRLVTVREVCRRPNGEVEVFVDDGHPANPYLLTNGFVIALALPPAALEVP